MKGLVSDALNQIKDWFSSFLDTIVETIAAKLAPCVTDCANMGITIYNDILGDAIKVLTSNPMEWSSEGWRFIHEEVYPVFLMVACPLVAIFWLARLQSESIDPKMHGDTRPDVLLFSFIKLAIAEFVTVYALWLVIALFSFVDLLTGDWVSANAKISTSLGFTESQVKALPVLVLFFTLIVSFVYMVVLIVVACVIAYIATVRFLKILGLIPFGSLASSTIAGTREVNNTAIQFWKYMIGVVLEAVLILLILTLCAKVQGSLNIISLSGNYRIMGIFLNRILIVLLCLGGVKGAGTMLQKIGLGN